MKQEVWQRQLQTAAAEYEKSLRTTVFKHLAYRAVLKEELELLSSLTDYILSKNMSYKDQP